MSKKILVLSGSPRKNGNSSILCDQFIIGAQEAGHESEKIHIINQKINFCIGCTRCQANGGTCVHKDDMENILQKLILADVIVLASPVYFYSIHSLMKTLIDRTFSKFTQLTNKDIYLIVTGGADASRYLDSAIEDFRGFISCLPNANEKGIIYGLNTSDAGTVRDTPAMQEAYEMGKHI